MSSLDMDLQDNLDLMGKEDISYKDGLHDQELSHVAIMASSFVDFNFQNTFLSKVKILPTGKSNMFKSGYALIMCWSTVQRMSEI